MKLKLIFPYSGNFCGHWSCTFSHFAYWWCSTIFNFRYVEKHILGWLTFCRLGWFEFCKNKKFKVGFVKMYFLGKNWIFNLVWMSWVVNLKRAQIPIEVYSVLLEWTDLWKRSRQSRDLKRRKGLHCCSFVKFNSSWWLFSETSKHSCYFSRKKEG